MLVQLTLSICLIIKNEEKHLYQCLSSVKDIASEIIVVDTGSTDNSILIASQFTTQIYSYRWKNDFSSARNFCLNKANGEWILTLDGDEELDVNCLNVLQEKIQAPDIEAYLLALNHCSKNPHELLTIPDLQPRLYRNNKQYRYRGIIHEQILDSILESNPATRIEIAQDIKITHYGFSEEEPENRQRLKRNTDLVNKALDSSDEALLKHLYLGREYYRHHKFAESLKHYNSVYKMADPREDYFPEILCSIAVSLYMLDKTTDVLSFIDNTLSIRADMGDLHYLKAMIHKNNFQYSEAYQSFMKCLTFPAQPLHNSSVYCQQKYKIYFYMGGLSEYFMDKDSALFYYLKSLKQNPYMLDSLRRMIGILNPRINPEYTINSLNRVFDLNDVSIQIELALIFYKEGAYQLALDCINYLEGSQQISENTRLLKGLCLLRNKQYSTAEEELQIINNNKILYITARQYLLLYYWLVQDYRKVSDCLKTIKTAGADPATIYVLNLLTTGDTSKINTGQNQAYTLAKEIMDLLVELGDSYQINGTWQRLAPLLGDKPSRLLAELYYKHEKYELAEEEFRYLLETDNIDAQAFYYLGKTCWVRGDLKTAEKYLCEIVDKGLDTPKIRWEIARLYQELAIATLKEGLKYCPDSEEQEKLLEELEDKLLEV